MRIVKERKASTSYGRGSDNYRTPASYAVVDSTGKKIGWINGTDAGFMGKSSWTVYWMDGSMPRVKYYAKNFADAKAWAIAWDGSPPTGK